MLLGLKIFAKVCLTSASGEPRLQAYSSRGSTGRPGQRAKRAWSGWRTSAKMNC